jgi:DNA helicase HerA-like ATPase
MTNLELFTKNEIIGVFRGFSEGGLEFHADLILPYRSEFQSIPMHGQFLLVQLETPYEAVLGRITSLASAGKLSSGVGEEFNIRAMREGRPVPEDLREQYLKYQIDIRVLGVVRNNHNGKLDFVASHRRLPHVGSPVAFLSQDVLRELAGHNVKGAGIGHFALGEYIYAKGSKLLNQEDWMQVKDPEVLVKFPIENLVSRRSMIFARAGFGKSNLNKLLFSELYRIDPKVVKRGNREVPVGTVLFDPDGEYFWPDDKGRPGLCDVPHLEDKLVVFTNRKAPSDYYASFVAGGIRLDIRRLKPSDVISIAVSPDRQDQQNIRKLRGLSQSQWERLVDLIDEYGYQAEDSEIAKLLSLKDSEEAQINAARANMTNIVRMLHDKSSQLMDRLLLALEKGKLCIVDVSQMRGSQSLILSSLILRRIFDRNQLEFTAAEPKTIPTIAVVEEAQAVLNEKGVASEPYIAWVKEGRKYDLGAVLITQQPGSIPTEILSQGDNWFIFHLLSAADLNSIRSANAHFSQDILSAILNEPIPGQGVFWSSASGKPFPVAIRVLDFEKMYSRRDRNYDQSAAITFASKLKEEFEEDLEEVTSGLEQLGGSGFADELFDEYESVDLLKAYKTNALKQAQSDEAFVQKVISKDGIHWYGIIIAIKNCLPKNLDNPDDIAASLVSDFLDIIHGKDNWETYKTPSKTNPQKETLYVKKK